MGYVETVTARAPNEFWTLEGSPAGGIYPGINGRTLTAAGSIVAAVTQLCPPRPANPNCTGGQLNGTNVAAYSPQAGATGKMSLELVVQPNSIAIATGMTVTKSGAAAYEWDFRINSGVPEFYVFTSAGVDILHILGAPSLAVAATYHIVATYDRAASSGALYVNGVSVGTPTWAAGNSSATGSNLQVCHRADGAGNNYQGRIGYIAIYPDVLTQAEASAHSNLLREENAGGKLLTTLLLSS